MVKKSLKPKWMPFDEAREFARSLGLQNYGAWKEWIKSGNRPANIPSAPDGTYRNHGWVGWEDWLRLEPKWMPFDEAREFARSLGLQNYGAWKEWASSDNRPANIPSSPDRTYRNQGWVGWGDWLRYSSLEPRWMPFDEAREFARSLGLLNHGSWKEWASSDNRPANIPSSPDGTYRNQGWVGWGDWLRYPFLDFVAAREYVRKLNLRSQAEWDLWRSSEARPRYIPKNPESTYKKKWAGILDWLRVEEVAVVYLPFHEAREFARTLGLKSQREWSAWAKSDARPKCIPVTPSRYKEWAGLGDWLGTMNVAYRDREYLPYEEARAIVRSMGFKTLEEWKKWSKTERPVNIPSAPIRYYKHEWRGAEDWLGTKTAKKGGPVSKYLPYEEAKQFARGLGLKNTDEWVQWARSDKRPPEIPIAPHAVYLKQWKGMGDWLGVLNSWTIHTVRNFIQTLIPKLAGLSPADRWLLFQKSGFLESSVLGGRSYSIAKWIASGRFPIKDLQEFAEGGPLNLPCELKNTAEDPYVADRLVNEGELGSSAVADTDPQQVLAALSLADPIADDLDAVTYLLASAKAKLWASVFNNEEAINEIRSFVGDGYADTVRKTFLTEYEEAKALVVPEGYSFTQVGQTCITPPNLMQRFIASRIKRDVRMGNWSKTGTGKTNSAILASRVVGARTTLVLCPNNVIDGWKSAIKAMFPDSEVVSKTFTPEWSDATQHRYLVLNYEMFQQEYSEGSMNDLASNEFDFVVIDEVQFVKQRKLGDVSLRRRNLLSFMAQAGQINPGIYVLGMSATPVINDLREPLALIELITGLENNKSHLFPTIDNCMRVYQELTKLGPRWVMNHSTGFQQREVLVDCSDQLDEILALGTKSTTLQLEEILTRARIPTILDSLVPKTVVYTHNIGGEIRVDEQLRKAIESRGWKVGFFTGDDKTGLERFLDPKGDIQVLIASSAISTGVDRLQHVCNRLVLNVLPWTSAEFEQLIGRFRRQGQVRDVEIVIPVTYAEVTGEEWSWCKSKLQRLLFKKTIADATVDGVIPEGHLRTQEQAHRDIMAWLHRLNKQVAA